MGAAPTPFPLTHLSTLSGEEEIHPTPASLGLHPCLSLYLPLHTDLQGAKATAVFCPVYLQYPMWLMSKHSFFLLQQWTNEGILSPVF